ncbi:hypothetical protein [Maricaulis sp.]|uniref:hypothetical protein n=1 Tax=Maricaulis sp. TaxID=1486257 RepID=UPI003A91B678
MSQLPTAHAGQSFGSRRIDFITVSGEVSSSDAGTGRVTDGDGVVHDVRLDERTSALAAGDTATVLRVQSGPNRRSRPVAIINHSRNVWMRAAPDATTILGRSGVTRTLNWWLSVLALALTAIAAAWPALHSFLTELNGAMMAGVPSIDIFALLGAQMPGLASWRMETALASGLFDAVAALGFVPMEQLTEWSLAIAVAALSLVAFFARSWRLLYVPALALLCVVSGAILGSPDATLLMIGGAVLLFIVGGFINRIRDGGRFNARVERLAEYVLRHPPEEGVRTLEPARAEPAAPEPLAAAVAATAIAAASAVAQGDETSDASAATPDEDMTTETSIAAEPAQSAANGEVAAGSDDDETSELQSAEPESTEPESAGPESAEPDLTAAEASEPGATETAAAEAETSRTDNTEAAAAADDEASPAPLTMAEAAPNSEAAPEPDTNADDEDLPSLEAVAAAAAISDTERAGTNTAATAAALDEDRTMPVVAPPPMPVAAAGTGSVAAIAEPAEPEIEAVEALIEAPAASAGIPAIAAAIPGGLESEAIPAPELAATAPQAEVPLEAGSENSVATPAIEDPMIDDDHDPMMESANGDFAPGAPEIDVESEKSD